MSDLHFHPHSQLLRGLKALLLVILIVAGAVLIRNWTKSYNYIGVPETRDMISVEGTGKVTVVPDVATFSLGVMTEKSLVAEAQKENTTKMNKIVSTLQEMGIDQKDLQTSQYNIYPQYNWLNDRQSLRGYQVSQDLTVKVRNLDKVGEVFARAGDLGANNIGGLQFTVDDIEKSKDEARLAAITDAKTKAETLADAAGMKLGKIVGYWENPSGIVPMMAKSVMDYGLGMGGGLTAPTPEIQVGSNEIIMTVSLSYEVL
ncbi:MAG: SIMPL domain-containing protein [Patescibacteria group bacterium]